MYKITCLIDNIEFSHELKGQEKKKLSQYLKKVHNMTYEEYILKFIHNGNHPLCACGCKNKTLFFKGYFFKYYKDHKNRTKQTTETKNKIKKTKNNTLNIQYKLTRLGYSSDDLRKMYDNFCDFKINLSDLEKTICIDKRTIKKYWLDLGFVVDKENFNRIIKKHKFFWQNKNNKAGGRKYIENNLLVNIFFFLKKESNKYTLKEIINKFNLPVTQLVLYKRLSEEFGSKIIDDLIKLGISSKPELEFYNILKFYFGNKLSKSFKLEKKVYDYILNDKLLIEFDGEYWHSLLKNKENDKIKDEIAIKNNYKIFRVKEKEATDISILEKIKKLAYED